MLRAVFANNVRAYRKLRGYSQERLAELSELHRTYISGIESCSRNVSLKSVEKISIALQVPPEELLTQKESYYGE